MSEPPTPPAKKIKQLKGHCPKCGPDRYADVVGHHTDRDDDDENGVWGQTDARILSCAGCKTIYFQEVFIFSEDVDYSYHPVTGETQGKYNERITYWPAPTKRDRPDWLGDVQLIDLSLHRILLEIYKGLDADLPILSAIGVRTAFDRTSELLKVDPGLPFAGKLTTLERSGKIGVGEKIHLEILTDAGSAAAHRGWSPSLDELDTMMNILEGFIYRTLILDEQVAKLKPAIPSKPPRPSKS